MSANHASRGMAFEALLELQHRVYAARGVAVITKHPTPWGLIRRDGVLSAHPRRKSIADFTGILAGGRALAVEAKSCGKPRWSLDDNLHAHQRRYLASVDRAGGVALLLLHWTRHDETWVFRWTEMAVIIDGAVASLARQHGWPRVAGHAVGPVDYLGALENEAPNLTPRSAAE